MDMHVDDRFRGHRALRRGRVSLPGQVYHVTVATRDRIPWFADFHVASEAVRAFHQPLVLDDALLLAWVLMPDHVHWLLEMGRGMSMERVVARMKSASGVRANRVLSRAGPLWQPAFHDRALRREDDLRSVARYIVANPLRAGLVERIGDYPFWNCAWL
jgi:REP element-mobilizing transposase RayT